MWGWIIILIAFLAVLFIAKLSHLKHKLSIIFLLVFLLFIGFSFMKVADTNSVEIDSASGFMSAAQLYMSWLGHAFDNMRVLTGNAVRMNWFSNSTA